MSKYWNDNTKKLDPYIPGEQPKDKKYIKLNTNENPYPPSPRVIEAVQQAADESLRLYPDPDCDELTSTIAQYHNVNKNQVFVGNGSDEVLAFAFAAFFNPALPILFPDITYSFYPVYANFFNVDYKLIPLDSEFTIPVKEFFIENAGIIIPNPNAPTSKYLPISSIKELLEYNYKAGKIVIIDEAYIDFGGESAVTLINEYPNLLVIQTLSKSRSLAGLRVGFAIGHEELIEGLNRVKNSFNSYTLDRLAQVGAIEAFKDEEYFQQTRTRTIHTREWISNKLESIGFNVVESKANFIFISHSVIQANVLFQQLREKGILVRYFNKPRIDNYLRVSIGTEEEMQEFFRVINEIVAKTK